MRLMQTFFLFEGNVNYLLILLLKFHSKQLSNIRRGSVRWNYNLTFIEFLSICLLPIYFIRILQNNFHFIYFQMQKKPNVSSGIDNNVTKVNMYIYCDRTCTWNTWIACWQSSPPLFKFPAETQSSQVPAIYHQNAFPYHTNSETTKLLAVINN